MTAYSGHPFCMLAAKRETLLSTAQFLLIDGTAPFSILKSYMRRFQLDEEKLVKQALPVGCLQRRGFNFPAGAAIAVHHRTSLENER